MTDVVVTAIDSDNNFFIQDALGGAFSGIRILNASNQALGTMVVGSRVSLTGTYEEFYTESQIRLLRLDSTEPGSPVQPAVVNPEEVATNGIWAEAYEGVFVRVLDVIVINSNPDAPGNDYSEFMVTGNLRVDDELWETSPDPRRNQYFVSLTGVMRFSYNNTKLLVRGPHDVVEGEITWEGLYNEELLLALYDAVGGHYSLGYNRAREEMFNSIDVHNGEVECYYTGDRTVPDGSREPGDFNTEHCWPQGQFNQQGTPRADLHHLFPTLSNVNSARSAWDFGETDVPANTYCVDENDCSFRGPSNITGLTIFQVRPSRRGDIARAHFYMVARYRFDEVTLIDDTDLLDVGSINATEESVLRLWHVQDPVDEMEMERNNIIEDLQGNRNPFIDYPELVDRIENF